jgi:hypothetical protein
LISDKAHEECGVFGIWRRDGQGVVASAYHALYRFSTGPGELRHRGEHRRINRLPQGRWPVNSVNPPGGLAGDADGQAAWAIAATHRPAATTAAMPSPI